MVADRRGGLLLTGIAVYFYYATRTHDDTQREKLIILLKPFHFIKEFEKDYRLPIKNILKK